jgi:hypothetical protein
MPSDPTGWPDEARPKEPTPGDDRYAIRFTLADVEARVEAAAVAMRTRCALEHKEVAENYARANDDENSARHFGWSGRIMNLPTPTDALAAALAQARRDALEEALTIAREAQSFVVYERIQAAIRAKAQEIKG